MPYICLLQEGANSFSALLEKASKNNFSVVATPINVIEDMPFEFHRMALTEPAKGFFYPDLILGPEQWNTKFITIFSGNIDCDSENPIVRRKSEEGILRDLSWAEHLQYAGYSLLELTSGRNINLARIVSNKLTKGVLLVQVPFYSRKKRQSLHRDVKSEELEHSQEEDTWQWWNRFRWCCDFHSKIRVVLELHKADVPTHEVVRRWLGEPLEALLIPSDMFIRNRSNFPVLPKVWNPILALFMRAHVNVIVSAGVNDDSLQLYAEYLNNFREVHKDEHQLISFEDVLEIPLQPLYDNLDCYTYEVFEKDPVKYKLYQDAIASALMDRVSEDDIQNKLTVIMVLGAGRGPLVRSALNASKITKRKVRIYIIEKNPNAIRTLHNVAKKMWDDQDVHIFSKDMREFSPPECADILVSELLGSFGDNELSPECLDCAQKLLKHGGISIPCKSTSYINPIMSSKLLNAVRHITRLDHLSHEKSQTFNTHNESSFVTLLKNIYNIDKPQALFEFVHPNPIIPDDNSRYKIVRFDVSMDCVLTGIGGYFEAVLYKNIMLSINPLTHTLGMASWFPMYFPFSEPFNLKAGQTIEIHFWRCVSKQKIWYEWALTKPFTSHVHNLGGHACSIYCI